MPLYPVPCPKESDPYLRRDVEHDEPITAAEIAIWVLLFAVLILTVATLIAS